MTALAIIKHLLGTEERRRERRKHLRENILALPRSATIGSTRDTPIMIPQSLRNEKADSGRGAVCEWRNFPRSPPLARWVGGSVDRVSRGRSVTLNRNLLTVESVEGRVLEPCYQSASPAITYHLRVR